MRAASSGEMGASAMRREQSHYLNLDPHDGRCAASEVDFSCSSSGRGHRIPTDIACKRSRVSGGNGDGDGNCDRDCDCDGNCDCDCDCDGNCDCDCDCDSNCNCRDRSPVSRRLWWWRSCTAVFRCCVECRCGEA
jgi:hypothetical protein